MFVKRFARLAGAGIMKRSDYMKELMGMIDVDHVTQNNHRKHAYHCKQLYIIMNNPLCEYFVWCIPQDPTPPGINFKYF